MTCPECDRKLERDAWMGDAAFACRGCGGRAVPVATLQRAAPTEFFAAYQKAAAESVAGPAVACPACRRLMRRLFVPASGLRIELEACRWCRLLWFDRAELQQVPTRPRLASDDASVASARRALAIEQVRADAARSRGLAGFDPRELSWPQQLLVFLGFPIEEGDLAPERPPLLTWGVAAALLLAWLASLADPDAAIERFGFVPSRAWELGGFTLVSAFFVHAGFFHLAGNAWLLVLAGDNLEERLGRLRWIALLAASTLAGHLLHALFEPRGDLPAVGASGGVAGFLACYTILWPHQRIVLRPPGMFRFARMLTTWSWWESQFFAFPSWYLFACWIALQFLLAWYQTYGGGSVSGLAHLGGAGVGCAAGAWWRAKERRDGAPPFS